MAKTIINDLRLNASQNLVTNGNFDIWQRGNSFTSIANAAFSADRFSYLKVGAMVHNITKDTDVPTDTDIPASNSLRLNLTTPDTSIATGDYCAVVHRIEGYNFQRILKQSFTLSFWVKATLPGTYCIAFVNSSAFAPNRRHYIAEYTIDVADTWEKKEISVPAMPEAYRTYFDVTNGPGLQIVWTIAAGTDRQAAAGWNTSSGFQIATSNQINGTNTGSTNFRLAQVMLNPGSEAMPFSLAGGDYATELSICQRYYTALSLTHIGYRSGPNATVTVNFPVAMRADPSVSYTLELNDTPGQSFALTSVSTVAFVGFLPATAGYYDFTTLLLNAEM